MNSCCQKYLILNIPYIKEKGPKERIFIFSYFLQSEIQVDVQMYSKERVETIEYIFVPAGYFIPVDSVSTSSITRCIFFHVYWKNSPVLMHWATTWKSLNSISGNSV